LDSNGKPLADPTKLLKGSKKHKEYKMEKRLLKIKKRGEKLRIQADRLMIESRRAAQQYDQYIKLKVRYETCQAHESPV
jgi:hypothetical protein